jgi:Na+/H+ antiporter NhaB
VTLSRAFGHNFLGSSPTWYKLTIVAFLALNPLLFYVSPKLAGWGLVAEFIFTLAMALRCYPLQPGGLLVLEAVAIGMTSPDSLYTETLNNIQVVLLSFDLHGCRRVLSQGHAVVHVHEALDQSALENSARAPVLLRRGVLIGVS